jgi:hypothetical protein
MKGKMKGKRAQKVKKERESFEKSLSMRELFP